MLITQFRVLFLQAIMIEYVGDVITIWVIVIGILLMLVLCSFLVNCIMNEDDRKRRKNEESNSSSERGKLVQ